MIRKSIFVYVLYILKARNVNQEDMHLQFTIVKICSQRLTNKKGSELNVHLKHICCKLKKKKKKGICDVARLMVCFQIVHEVTLMQDVYISLTPYYWLFLTGHLFKPCPMSFSHCRFLFSPLQECTLFMLL